MSLRIREVVKRFGNLTALDGVSLDIDAGEFVCFLGPSGCGKTTLLRVVAGLEQADGGEVLLDDRDLIAVPARLRNFGVVFQSYSLFPNMTAARNVAYGLECRRWPKNRIAERVDEMLRVVELADQAQKYPPQMSGGQQQRIALARALAPDPSLLLLDEPLSALDAKVREDLRLEIRALQQRLGITTIMVTHDQEEALTMADRIVVMRSGRIEQVGSAHELYQKPETRFVAEFIGRMNVLPVEGGAEALHFAGHPLHLQRTTKDRTPAVLGLRPEEIRLSSSGGTEAPNRIPVRVRQSIFLGNITHVVLEVSDNAQPLVAEVHAGDDQPVTEGTMLQAELPANALRVLEWR
ncbi:ABC transporter ATP-binding protein [Aquibaculum arenosum]|uniref:Spermidine/putrescine import ATP-binding protein PotA n=1 Tax=Aquibaculum arenosum TaxID=3032591 RepID=A0ABT5YJZ8_9PROT|nr:polyamine ABC transporter ATP-binding protein [Fodinicurvata sp. CAU 1616]MDF2095110.1 polyamine ABC transporter ATP-binding protein [Fodinicurvata sp. CAU 1616]